MDRLVHPKALVLEGNLVENWKKWKQDFTIYMTATEYDGKDEKIKSSLLLHCIGEKSREVYHTFNFEDGEELIFNKIIEKFDEYFAPRKNITYSRYNFFTYRQISYL